MVAPVSGLVSTVLPVAVALAEGERPGAGSPCAPPCLVAIVLASSVGSTGEAGPLRPAGPGHRLRHRLGRLVRPVLPAHPQRRAVRRGVAGGGRADRRAGGRPGRRGRAAAWPAARRRRRRSPGGGRRGRHRRRGGRSATVAGHPGTCRVRPGRGAGRPVPRSHRAAGPGWCSASACAGSSISASPWPHSASCSSPPDRRSRDP